MKTSSAKLREPVFYGWIMVLGGIFPIMMTYGMMNNTFNIYVKSIGEYFDVSRSKVVIGYTLITFAMMLANASTGKINRYLSLKKIFILGELLLIAGGVGYALAKSLYTYYFSSVLIGLGLGGVCYLPVSLLLGNWFVKKRGLALSLGMSATGLGGVLFIQLGNAVMRYSSWQMSYLLYVSLILVVVLPLTLILIRDQPESKGLRPYGSAEPKREAPPEHAPILTTENPLNVGIPLARARRTPQYWLITTGILCLLLAISGTYPNIPSYLTDMGYSQNTAANVTSIILVVMIFGKLLMGVLFDRIGWKAVVCLLFCQFTLALVFLLLINHTIFLIGFTLLYGLAAGGLGDILLPLIAEDIFGKIDLGSILGSIAVITGGISAFGGWAVNVIYDVTGSYQISWFLFACLTQFGMLCLLRVKKMRKDGPDGIRH